MAFHIVITDDDGTTLNDVETDGIALAYCAPEGIHGETLIGCDGLKLLRLAITLDKLRERIVSKDPFLRLMYDLQVETVSETVEIDIGAIKRALNKQEDDDD